MQYRQAKKTTHDGHGQPRAISTSVQSTLWYGNSLTISPEAVGGGWMSPTASPGHLRPLSAWLWCFTLFRAHLLEWWKRQGCGLLLPDGGQHVHKGSTQTHSNLGIASACIVSIHTCRSLASLFIKFTISSVFVIHPVCNYDIPAAVSRVKLARGMTWWWLVEALWAWLLQGRSHWGIPGWALLCSRRRTA